MSKNIKRWLLVFVCCIATVGVLGGVKFGQISAAIAFGQSFPEPSETILVSEAVAFEYIPRVRAAAEIVPVRFVSIRNEIAGAIVAVGFSPGQPVDEGQVLLQLDISEEQASLAAARARVALAERTLERNESLATRSAISRQAADDALAERDSALADAARVQAVINKKTLRAPFAAHTGLERWEVGGYLAAGTEVTGLVGNGSEVWVDFALPQQNASIEIGSSVELTLDDTAPLSAIVIARAPGVDPIARAVRYRAIVDDSRLSAILGAIVSVSVAVGQPVSVISLPAISVREDTFGTHVFTLAEAESGADANYRAVRRAVTVLAVDAETAYLSAGLEVGERVVAQGAFKLRSGILVNIGSHSAVDTDSL